MLDLIVVLAFPALMALAASYDLLTMTIPNRLSLVLLGTFAVAVLVTGMSLHDLGLHLAAGAAVLVVGFAFFAAGWIGGGDAKLAAAAGIWIGWSHLLEYALLFSIFGGILTIIIMVGRTLPLPPLLHRAAWLVRLHDRGNGVPYGIALAAAALILFPETGWMA